MVLFRVVFPKVNSLAARRWVEKLGATPPFPRFEGRPVAFGAAWLVAGLAHLLRHRCLCRAIRAVRGGCLLAPHQGRTAFAGVCLTSPGARCPGLFCEAHAVNRWKLSGGPPRIRLGASGGYPGINSSNIAGASTDGLVLLLSVPVRVGRGASGRDPASSVCTCVAQRLVWLAIRSCVGAIWLLAPAKWRTVAV